MNYQEPDNLFPQPRIFIKFLLSDFKMPKDYSRQVDFTEEGEVGLESKLRKAGFIVEGRYRLKDIHENSPQSRTKLGYIDPYNGRILLNILAIEGNPLEEFVKNYDKPTPKQKPRTNLRTR